MTTTDPELWEGFQTATLPRDAWTHASHLRVAWMYLRRYAVDEAHILMRVGIIRLNAAHGLVESATRGYHETLTRVWLLLVAEAMQATPEHEESAAFLAAHAVALGKDAPLRHYSRERIFSAEARARFVAPDLRALPSQRQ